MVVLEQLGLASAPRALQFAELTGSPVRPRQQTAGLVRAPVSCQLHHCPDAQVARPQLTSDERRRSPAESSSALLTELY